MEDIQKKGLAKVAKKAGAIAAEGMVHAYIHAGSRVGVLVEVNCQTDFVARNEDFQAFVTDVAMQIASMSPLYVRESDIPEADVVAQTNLFAGQMEEEARESGKSKPPEAVKMILEGKVAKWKKENCLLDQVSIMVEDKKTIADIGDELSARIGEKISIRRFVRYELGEGIEKKKADLAADVAETLAGG
jgi:elongation factor Ts